MVQEVPHDEGGHTNMAENNGMWNLDLTHYMGIFRHLDKIRKEVEDWSEEKRGMNRHIYGRITRLWKIKIKERKENILTIHHKNVS